MKRFENRILGIVLTLVSMTHDASAQSKFPSEALIRSPNQQSALALLGATQAENSGYLLLDAPDIAHAGRVKVVGKSKLPGTSQLVLLRVTRVAYGQTINERPFVAASSFTPGHRAAINVELDAASTLNLVLLAQARGKWFFVTREIKIGRVEHTR